ncbi:START-like domain-containing protein [Leadbetterella sp. DM7]|uniref:START-like domain-containing protein n=1 Tax=Leadbetterella sp. DM7 TaxID=3235085 RepID=UPI00349E6ACD
MAKFKYTQEFPFRASPKVLYNYISTPGGLQQWFAESVRLNSDSKFVFNWDGKDHVAELTSSRLNKSSRFDFTGEDEGNFLEFKFVTSELDNSTYLKVTDNSDNDDADDLETMWNELISHLKEIVGG